MRTRLLFSCILIAMAPSVQAATGTVNFTGSVTATCSLVVTNPAGVMTPSASLQVLSSKNAGGTPGTLSLTTTGGVVLSLDAVASAIQPAGDSTATSWTASYGMSGVQSVLDASTPTTIVAPGSGTVNVHLTGTKSGSSSFVNGSYGATVTVRCEP